MVFAKIGPKGMSANNLAHCTDTKTKVKVQLPTKVAPKKKNHPMLEINNKVLCYQSKSCLCRRWDVRSWLWGTKPSHVCPANKMFRSWLCSTKPHCVCRVDGMLKVGFVILSQIMFVAEKEC